jgi:hypothetical protein
MTNYKVTIEGYESGLTAEALESQVEGQFPQQEVEVEIVHSNTGPTEQ